MKGWENKNLARICCFVTERTSVIDKRSYISTENMLQNCMGIETATSIPQGIRVIHYCFGDVLVSNIRPYLKKIWYANKEGGCSNDISVFRAHSGVYSLFLYYLVSQDKFFCFANETAIGIKMPRLNKTTILDFNILLPPLPEQRAIAGVLSDMDGYISALEQLIDKKRNIKKGAMLELLTGKRRLPGFNGEWVEKRIGDIGYTYSGLRGKSKAYFGKGNSKYITFLNVLMNTVIDTEILELVEVDEFENQNAVQIGDLFFNTSSETPEEVGMCAILTNNIPNTYLNSFCFGFRLIDKDVEGLFLSYYFNSGEGRKNMTLLAQGATRYNLSKAYFINMTLFIPNLSEQLAIASVLSDMDTEIEALMGKLNKLCNIKHGMMQELLSGRIKLFREDTDNGKN